MILRIKTSRSQSAALYLHNAEHPANQYGSDVLSPGCDPVTSDHNNTHVSSCQTQPCEYREFGLRQLASDV
jgi:hypothetical protein